MKLVFFIALIFSSIFYVNAQNDSIMVYKVEYERKITPENFTKSFYACLELKYYLELNFSVFDSCNPSNSDGVETIDDKDEDSHFYYTPKGKNIRCVIKDYSNNELFNKQEIAKKYFTIKDSLNIFNWKIKTETKDILGHKCQLAEMRFRDRDYTAWFSPDLPVGGPWKYDGLPGMILEIKSNTPFIEFKANAIISKKIPAKPIDNPLEKNKKITWSQFKSIYKKKAIELSNFNPEKTSGAIILPRKGIERYIEEDDMDYIADKEFKKQLSEK